MNIIQKFFINCSGADANTLADATTAERNTFVTLGMTVLIPTLLGYCSGGYAAFLITNNKQIAITFGLLWALIIFIIDRSVVSSMSGSVLPAIGRLCLAILIGIVVSLPLELKIFGDAISEELNRAYSTNVAAVQAAYTHKIDAIDADLKQRKSEISSLRDNYLDEMDGGGGSGKRGYGPYAIQKRAEYEQAKSEFTVYRQDRLLERSSLKQQEMDEIARLQNKQATGLLGQWKALGQLSKREPYVLYASWALTLIFILIELIPILVKLSISNTLYKRLINANDEATIEHVVPLLRSRKEIEALREGLTQQDELNRMTLEKANKDVQLNVDLAEAHIEQLLHITKLEEQATSQFSKLAVRPSKIADSVDKMQQIVDFYSEKIYENPKKDEALQDLIK